MIFYNEMAAKCITWPTGEMRKKKRKWMLHISFATSFAKEWNLSHLFLPCFRVRQPCPILGKVFRIWALRRRPPPSGQRSVEAGELLLHTCLWASLGSSEELHKKKKKKLYYIPARQSPRLTMWEEPASVQETKGQQQQRRACSSIYMA